MSTTPLDWLYQDILYTSVMANLALPMSHEVLYYAAVCFGVGMPMFVFASGLIGSLAALQVNIGVGVLIAKMNLSAEHPAFLRVRRVANRYLVWLLLIPGLVFHGMFTVMLGAAGVSWKRLMLAGVIEHILRYGVTSFVSRNTDILVPIVDWLKG